MKTINVRIGLLFSLSVLCILTACEREKVNHNGCYFDSTYDCGGFTFSIVDLDTYENIIGEEDHLIDPTEMRIKNVDDHIMWFDFRKSSDGWYGISFYGVFEEFECFNQCLLDSSFTRTYYLDIGNNDIDTLEVFVEAHKMGPTTFYNGLSGEYQQDLPSDFSPRTAFIFRKKL